MHAYYMQGLRNPHYCTFWGIDNILEVDGHGAEEYANAIIQSS